MALQSDKKLSQAKFKIDYVLIMKAITSQNKNKCVK